MQKKDWKKILKYFLIFISVIFFVIILILINLYLKPRKINVTFFDDGKENQEIQKHIESYFYLNSGSLIKYFLLSEDDLSKDAHAEFPIVDNIKINKNLNLTVDLIVTKNKKFFATCMEEDQFLVKCALGNENGVFYEEKEDNASDTLRIVLDKDAIYDTANEKKIDDPDTISLNRIYTKNDFTNLRELINYFKKNYDVSKVEVGKLKIAKIYLNDFYVSVDMETSFVDTIKNFEIISRTGALKDYLNDSPKEIKYIDLSFKNKIFYKLVKDEKDGIMSGLNSTSTGSTTTNVSTTTPR